MKKLLLFALIVCLLLPAVVSCSKDTPDTEGNTGTQAATTSGNSEPETDAPILFPDKDLEGKEIKVLMSTEMKAYCFAEELGISQVSDAVYDTYSAVEEKYNVEFVFDFESSQGKNTAKFNAKIETGVNSGFGKGYDFIMGQMHSISLANNGYYQNLAKTDSLNLDADYYYQSINNSSKIEGQLYAIAGAYNMDKVSMAIVYFFNKTMHEDLFGATEYSDLYGLVEDKKWTFETMKAMANTAASENGDSEWNEKDRYGLVGTNTGMAALVGSGVVSVSKNESEEYSLTFYNDLLTSVYGKYFDFFGQNHIKVDGTYKNEGIFTAGNALFYSSHVNRLGLMNGLTGFKIGVLPFPMFDEEQDNYRTYVNRSEMLFVPMNADIETSALIIEYLNYLFLQDVVTAYWDVSLTSRYAADAEDSEMLELARSCVFEDFGLTYTSELSYFYASAGTNLMTAVELTGWWEEVQAPVQEKLDTLIANYKTLADKNY